LSDSGPPASGPLAVDLSIIIATYNGRGVLADCLASLFQAAPACSFEVLVVDDASWDHTSEMVAERFPQVRLLRNETNIHYARSNNRALDLARGRFVYLLNNDTIMLPGAIDVMLAFLRERPAVGAVGSRLLNGDGSVQASVKAPPNIGSALFGARSPIAKLFPGNRLTRRHLLHLDRSASGPFEAGYVSSASVMIRREVIDRVGYLDERLSYHVDADYCKRIWDAGWEVYYVPSATVIHLAHQGGTMVTRSRRFKSVVEFHVGSYIYYRKHHGRLRWHPLHLVAAALLGLRFIISLGLQAVAELVDRGRGRPSSGHLVRRQRDGGL
jgi:GT2 family glycosyltransferase